MLAPVYRACLGCRGQLTGRQRKWCSEACRVRAYQDAQRGHEVERLEVCQQCGDPLTGAQRKWCSKRCNDQERMKAGLL